MRPLAERMRPLRLEDYVGQEHLLGQEGALRQIIKSGKLPSMILWGPPGVGKTSLAKLLAKHGDRAFFELSAINSGVKDVREAIGRAEKQGFFSQPSPILFIDEIHRFSKSQQDALLGAVERGVVTLIGATTENPSFEVISALLSRCQVYTLKHFEKSELLALLDNAIRNDEILQKREITVKESEALLKFSSGDARKLYNVLELLYHNAPVNARITIDNKSVESLVQENMALYDKGGEMHYDIISAFIKSIRGSDPNAAIYYLARMLEGGEDVRFICRRMIILAAEDIGLANPNALLIANACFESVHKIGMPEARIVMAECAIYLAQSMKSNSAYEAIEKAISEVRNSGNQAVPLHLRNAPSKLMKELDYGKDYKYAHAYDGNFAEQEFLPDKLSGSEFYTPGDNDAESRIRQHLSRLWKGKYGSY